jgi:hypothetical protein
MSITMKTIHLTAVRVVFATAATAATATDGHHTVRLVTILILAVAQKLEGQGPGRHRGGSRPEGICTVPDRLLLGRLHRASAKHGLEAIHVDAGSAVAVDGQDDVLWSHAAGPQRARGVQRRHPHAGTAASLAHDAKPPPLGAGLWVERVDCSGPVHVYRHLLHAAVGTDS